MAEQEMEKKGSYFGALLKGLLIGGIVGVAVTLLSAPQSGQETRDQIWEKSIELRDRAMDTVEDTRSQAESLRQEGIERANELAEKGQSTLNEQRANVMGAVEGVKQGVRALKE